MEVFRIIFWIVEMVLLGGISAYCFYLTALLISRRFEVPFVPTDRRSMEQAFAYIQPHQDQHLLELGCGNGSVICTMSRQYRLQAQGYEMNPFFVVICRVRAWIMGISSRVTIIRRDARLADYAWADVIFIFMTPPFINDRMITKHLLHTTRKGTHVISHWYPIGYLTDKLVHTVKVGSHNTYIYTI